MIIHRKDELTTSRWSGGTTTELFIHPAGSSYAARDFDVRISTATVERETSEFTHLPGYSRILVVLEGSLRMVFHNGKKAFELELDELEQAKFPGDHSVTAYGKIRDFNVMLRSGYEASVEDHRLAAGSVFEYESGTGFGIIFVLAGMVAAGNESCSAGDMVRTDDETTVRLVAGEDALVLVARVWQVE